MADLTPKPKVVRTVCDVCGLDWDKHAEPTLTECVRLLKAELAKPRPQSWSWSNNALFTPASYGGVQ